MTGVEMWTIGRLLEWTKDYLAKHGSDSPRLDAEVLLAHARDCPRIELYTAFDEVADERERSAFRELVKKRSQGTPVAYLVGNREFYSLSFLVNSHVLIPRPETELLVIRLLDLAKQYHSSGPIDIVDVGTGSGVLSICAALYLPQSRIVGIDVSEAALAVAKKNAERHAVLDRAKFVVGDLLSEMEARKQIDFVISNPPYVSESEFKVLDIQVKDHEPKLALVSGPTGTETIERLIPQAMRCLKPNGWLIMEISPMISESISGMLTDADEFTNVNITNDVAKLPRVVEAQRTGHTAQ